MRGQKRVLLLGLDGAEPSIFEDLTQRGALPNFSRLVKEGCYRKLWTTTPSISPVAWTSMLTGCSPGKHGNRGFVSRRLGTYNTACDLYDIEEDADGLPRYLRKKNVDTIADVLTRAGKTSYIISVPATFPPDAIQGVMLSGLGVPDIKGTFGSSAIYVSSLEGKPSNERYIQVGYPGKGQWFTSHIPGPKDISTPVHFLAVSEKLKVSLDKQKIVTEVACGQWSDWFRIPFATTGGRNFEGIGRFKLVELTDKELELYMTPVNYSPVNPLNDISAPPEFAPELAEEIGLFGTMGFTADHTALKARVISDETFIEYAYHAFQERLQVARYVIESKEWELFIMHFFLVDMLQHMFWRYTDPDHVLYDEAHAETAGKIIEQGYIDADRELGKLIESVPEDTLIMLMSDHGFSTLRNWVNINNWLYERGYLVLKEGEEEGYGEDTEGTFIRSFREAGSNRKAAIDWGRTRAFTCGFTGIHINLAGRDPLGCVKRGREYFQLKQEIIEGLKKLTDPRTGGPVFKKIVPREDIFVGKFAPTFPDLIPFLHVGYNLSRENVFGEIVRGAPVIQPNDNNWSGGHAGPYTPEDAAGILVVAGEGVKEGVSLEPAPRIWDLCPTILSVLGIDVPEHMDGKVLDIFT